jgi:hypothetical protein
MGAGRRIPTGNDAMAKLPTRKSTEKKGGTLEEMGLLHFQVNGGQCEQLRRGVESLPMITERAGVQLQRSPLGDFLQQSVVPGEHTRHTLE